MFHDKVGLFADGSGDVVGFRGSLNESYLGLSPDGKLVVDNGGHTIYANQRHLDLWRLTREDMALPFEGRWPKTAANLANPVQFVEMQRAVREGESGQPFEIETVDGRVIEVRSVALHGDGTRESARSYTTRDITAQRRAERDLRESETRYRTLVSSLPVGVVMQYADGRIGECNAAAERILGLSRGQLLGLSSFDARWHCVDEDGAPIAPDEHPAVVTLRTGEPCHNVVMGVYHVSGTLHWLLVNSEPIASPDGGVEAAVVSFQDVTEQRLGQSALIQSRTAEAFNALASGVAHKINNSLTSIVGNAYLAGLPAGVPDEPQFGPPRAGDVPHSRSDISAARAKLGYTPTVGVEEGLRAALEWYRAARGA